MTIAQESDVQQLISTYGERVIATPGFSCYHNGLKAAFEICAKGGGQIFARLWQVNFEDDTHVYLAHQSLTFNEYITWPDQKYPNLDMEDLKSRGEDVTAWTVAKAMEELQGESDEGTKCGFAEFLLYALPYNRFAKTPHS